MSKLHVTLMSFPAAHARSVRSTHPLAPTQNHSATFSPSSSLPPTPPFPPPSLLLSHSLSLSLLSLSPSLPASSLPPTSLSLPSHLPGTAPAPPVLAGKRRLRAARTPPRRRSPQSTPSRRPLTDRPATACLRGREKRRRRKGRWDVVAQRSAWVMWRVDRSAATTAWLPHCGERVRKGVDGRTYS